MASLRYRYIGETPVHIPALSWGATDAPVMPGDVSPPYDGEPLGPSPVVVLVGSDEEKAWLAAHKGKQEAKA